MIDKLTTVRRSSVLNHLGRLSSAKMSMSSAHCWSSLGLAGLATLELPGAPEIGRP